jgi:hypothetical protein
MAGKHSWKYGRSPESKKIGRSDEHPHSRNETARLYNSIKGGILANRSLAARFHAGFFSQAWNENPRHRRAAIAKFRSKPDIISASHTLFTPMTMQA